MGHRRCPARRPPARAGGPGCALPGAPLPRRRRLADADRPAGGPAAAADLPELAATPVEASEEAARIAALQAAIAQQPLAHWEQAFNAAGFGCHRVACIEDLRRAGLRELTDAERAAWRDGPSISVIRLLDHPVGSPVDNPAPTYARFATTSLRLTNPMPKIGSHTRSILRELGHDDARIDRWIAAGVAAEQIHDAYLPTDGCGTMAKGR